MPDSEYNWDWRRNLPPVPTFSLFGEPAMTTPVMANPYTSNAVSSLIGPGYAPQVVGNPTGVTMPSGIPLGVGGTTFGNPDPAAKQAAVAAQAVANDPNAAWKKALLDKNFGVALTELAKGFGAGKTAPQSQAFHVSGPTHISGGKSVAGPAGAAMNQALEKLSGADFDLTQPVQKRRRGEQARYDVLARRQSQDLSELFKNLV